MQTSLYDNFLAIYSGFSKSSYCCVMVFLRARSGVSEGDGVLFTLCYHYTKGDQCSDGVSAVIMSVILFLVQLVFSVPSK